MKSGHFAWNLDISHKIFTFLLIVQNSKVSGCSMLKHFLDHFAWECKIFAWSCKINLHIFLNLKPIFLIWFILHNHAILQHLVFELPFVIYSISLFWFHLNYLQLAQILVQTNCVTFHYAFGSSSTLFVLFNLIYLFCH